MRSSSGICLSCRNIVHQSYSNSIYYRAASSAARRRGTFNASKLVLDLEAADSKYVRRIEDDYEGKITASFRKQYQKSTLRSSKEKFPSHDNVSNPQRDFVFQATPPDYLNYALLGNPFDSETHVGKDLRDVFSTANLDREEDFENNIRWLKAKAEGAACDVPTATEKLLLKLRACCSIQELRRTTSLIAGTPNGCKFLATNGDAIRMAIKEAHHRGAEPGHVVKYINGLIQTLKAEGLEYGFLAETGMYYAASYCFLPALKYYIDSMDAKAYPVTSYRGKSILRLIKTLHGDEDEARKLNRSYQEVKPGKYRDVLRLVTGWEIGGVPDGNEQRQPCFATIIQGTPSLYALYIKGLGDLGASQSLWHEFSHPEQTEVPDKYIDIKHKVHLFAYAFVKAAGMHLAWQAQNKDLNTAQESQLSGTKHTNLAVKIPYSVQPQASSQSKIAKIEEALFAHLQSHGFRDVKEEQLRRELTRTSFDIGPPHSLHYLGELLNVKWSETGIEDGRKGLDG